MKWLFSLLVGALAVGGFGLWHTQAGARQTPAFRTATVERTSLAATISATGTLEPEEVVDVGAQVAGMIKSLGPDPRSPTKSIDYGSPVDEGTILALIDESLYQAQVEQANAQLGQAQAQVQQAGAQIDEANANI